MAITVTYIAADGATGTRRYKTLKGAQAFAWTRVGKTPDLGTSYAVSGDGVVTLYVQGATMGDLFPATKPAAAADRGDGWGPQGIMSYEQYQGDWNVDERDGEPTTTETLAEVLAKARAAIAALEHRGHHVTPRSLGTGVTFYVVREHDSGRPDYRGWTGSLLAARAEIDRCQDDRLYPGCTVDEEYIDRAEAMKAIRMAAAVSLAEAIKAFRMAAEVWRP